MKFRKITRILAVMAFATLMQATQAYADIIKIDAISLGSNPDVFMKFDDTLGSLVDVTYYYSGSTYAEIFHDEFGVGIAASDWVEGLTANASTYVSQDITCVQYCGDGGERILFIPSFDIFVGSNIYNIYFDFELSIPLFYAAEDFGTNSWISEFRTDSLFFGNWLHSSYCVVDGRFVATIAGMFCFTNAVLSASRVEYTYDDAVITTVSTPSTLAIFALGLMGIMSRRFKKQS
jgi:hypothetical protein